MRALYIAGYGHSGSTLYGIVLGASPGVLNVGELCQALERPELLRPEPDMSSQAADVLALVRKHVDACGGGAAPANFWHDLLCDLSCRSGSALIVDASKTAWRSLGRPRMLRDQGVVVFVLHLVRDPRAVVYSLYRKHRTSRACFRALFGWAVANLGTLVYCRCGAYRLSFYEDFMADPPAEIMALSHAVAFDFSRSALMLRQGRAFDVGCQIDGNRMARTGQPVCVRPDMAWRHEAPFRVLAIGAIGLPLYWLMRVLQRCRRQE